MNEREIIIYINKQTHREFNEVKLEKLSGIGPSKEFP
jgi:hypothetical protein